MHLRTVVVQVNTRDNLADNLSHVERFLDQAADVGASSLASPNSGPISDHLLDMIVLHKPFPDRSLRFCKKKRASTI